MRRLARVVGLSAGDTTDPEVQLPAARSLSTRVTLAVIGTGLLAAASLASIGFWATWEVDGLAAHREETLIRRALDDRIEGLPREQESITIWDDAVLYARAGDQLWMSENLGEWMYTYFGHDRAYVLDPRGVSIHAMVDGATVAAAAFQSDAAAIAPLVAALREQLKDPDADRGALGALDMLMIGGRPSLVSVKAIVPSSDRVEVPSGEEYLHVSVRHLDGAFFPDLGARYLVQGVRYHPGSGQPGQPAIELAGADGRSVGHLDWDRERPGLRMVRATGPGLAASVALIVLLIGLLVARLRRAIMQIRASELEAQHLAMHDTLTGLPNRALFNTRLGQALQAARCDDGRLALHYVDLDRFKNVNDTLGHPAGDELIRQAGARLAALVRDADTVARLGGDEFAIVQPGIRDRRDAEQLAERILEAIRMPFEIGGETIAVDSSIGAAIAPDATTDPVELMRKADIALYEAKGAGKGRLCIFEPELDEIVHRKRSIEWDLREAIDTGRQLWLEYQPLFAVDGTTLIGAEALARWEHPRHGRVPPSEFIPIAEERGLINDLGAWVMREACVTAKALDLPWVAVNVSAVQFRDPGFVDLVLDLLKELQFSPERLQIEITEGLLLDATDAVASTLTKLRFAGICIALDDFGTGYSSLRYLHRYKVDKIKIDRSFVMHLGTGESTDAIVQAMLDLGRALHLSVTAEGVETPGQWQALAALGSPELQGFLFSKPITADALQAMLAREQVTAGHGRRRTA